ncbi:MAG TPA: hypothetical protein VFA11_15190 [Acidimicrobiales bacterium]|nr:hypothetical protein [Acidimicrobiales bacterium]
MSGGRPARMSLVGTLVVVAAGLLPSCGGASPAAPPPAAGPRYSSAQLASALITSADLPAWYHQLRLAGAGTAPLLAACPPTSPPCPTPRPSSPPTA